MDILIGMACAFGGVIVGTVLGWFVRKLYGSKLDTTAQAVEKDLGLKKGP